MPESAPFFDAALRRGLRGQGDGGAARVLVVLGGYNKKVNFMP